MTTGGTGRRSALMITNELAGGTQADVVESALAVLRTGFVVQAEVCRSVDEIDAVLSRHRHPVVVIAGGDGSLHGLVAALSRRGETRERVVGLLPLGTGNDFARGHGVPLEPEAAAHAIADGEPVDVDLIVDDDTGGVVVNVVHAGVGAAAARAAAPAKPLLRRYAFPLGAVWAGLRSPGWRWHVEVDGRTVSRPQRRILMVAVALGPTIAGGGATVAPTAVHGDGLADITISHAVGPWERIRYALRLRRGTHPGDETVTYLRGRHVVVSGDDIWVNADGELYGPARRRAWTVRRAAWRLLVPPAPGR